MISTIYYRLLLVSFFCVSLLPISLKGQIINKVDSSHQSFTLSDFNLYHPELEHQVDTIFQGLTDSQRAGQMIVQAAGRLGRPTEVITKLVLEQKLGGVLLLGGEKEMLKNMVQQLNTLAEQSGGVPLLYSADAEPSLINRKIAGTQKVKNTVEIKTLDDCIATTQLINQDLLYMGVRQNFAPVCDLTPANKAIGNRSFGNNLDSVILMSNVFIEATQQAGIIATAKHFPGHGYVKGDSHEKLIYIDGELQELGTYTPLIRSGVISVMVGHIAVVNNEAYQTEGLPASCSRKIVTDLLKNEMGFKGLVTTDAMNMGALNKIPQAALKAVQAGCDMILMPKNENELHGQILEEMNKNEEFKNQVYTSVKKIIRLKLCLGLM